MARRALVNSVPKAGTHLLKRGLALLPGVTALDLHFDIRQSADEVRAGLRALPSGAAVTAHLVHRPDYVAALQGFDLARFLVLRDPRDVALSLAEYIPTLRAHYLHQLFTGLSFERRLLACIRGLAEPRPAWDCVALHDLGALYRQFLPWRGEPGVLCLRFEDLVGEAGGGDPGLQRATLAAVAGALDVALDEDGLAAVARGIFDPASPTFRRGEIGGWRARFGREHVRACKDVAGELLVELGYERDQEW